MHPLDGVWLKVRRGRLHMKEVNRLIKAFIKSHPYSVRIETDPQSGDKLWIANEGVKTPTLRLSAIVGDSIHNFRSTLDYLVWQLVKINGATPTNRTGFPICTQREQWSSAKTKLNGIADRAKALIKEQQPCFSTHTHNRRKFAFLHELDIVDKHKFIQLTVAATGGGLWSQTLPVSAVSETFILCGTVQANTILAKVPNTYAYVDFNPIGDIAFGQGTSAEGELIYITLYGFGFLLQRTIRLFSSFFPPSTTPSLHRFMK